MASRIARVLVCLSLVVLLGMASYLIWSLFTMPSESVPGEVVFREESAAPQLEEVLEDLSPIQGLSREERFFLDQHLEAIGGIKSLNSVRSLLSTGTITFADGGEFPLVVVKKQPNKIRVTMKRPEGQLVLVSTPEEQWSCLWRGGTLVNVGELDTATAEGLERSSYVVSELFLSMQNSWTVEYLGQQAFNYEMAHCFEVELSDRHRVRFYIDPETFLDTGREEWTFDENGELLLTRIFISDHLDIGGLKVGGKLELYENNEYKQTFVITDVEVNPGILPGTFHRPEAAPLVRQASAEAVPDQ